MKQGRPLRTRILSLLLLAAPASMAFAHPGHDHAITPPGHPLHFVIEPFHLMQGLALVALGAASFAAGQALRAGCHRLSLLRLKDRR